MAEAIGVISGVIGIVEPIATHIENFARRCENFLKIPNRAKDLADDCKILRRGLNQIEDDLKQQCNFIPLKSIGRFNAAAKDIRINLEEADRELKKKESLLFPESSSSSKWRAAPAAVMRKGLRFAGANYFATAIDEIQTTVTKAKEYLRQLEGFVCTTEQIQSVRNDVAAASAVSREIQTVVAPVPRQLVGVAEAVRDVHADVRALQESGASSGQHTVDAFKRQYLVPMLPPNVVHNFDDCDDKGNPATMEGELKQRLKVSDGNSQSQPGIVSVVGVSGMGGIGKTTALKALGWDNNVMDWFKEGGIYYIFVGRDATDLSIVTQLAEIVEETGGSLLATKIRSCQGVSDAAGKASGWFEDKRALFLCDDIWKTEQGSIGYLENLRELLSRSRGSRMVITTRSQAIARGGGQDPVEFSPLEPCGKESRETLRKYADVSAKEYANFPEKARKAFENVLDKCGGVRLTLGVAGRAVKRICKGHHGKQGEAFVIYSTLLENNISTVSTGEIDNYPNFISTVKTSLEMATDVSDEVIHCTKMFPRTCVLRRKGRVPLDVLGKAWGSIGGKTLHDIAEMLDDLNLISMRYEPDGRTTVAVHDLILFYCKREAANRAREYHGNLLDNYLAPEEHDCSDEVNIVALSTALSGGEAPEPARPWWSLSNDDYIRENVCRHLSASGRVGELSSLLLDFRWTAACIKNGKLPEWVSDFTYLFSGLQQEKDSSPQNGLQNVTKGMTKVRDAVSDAWSYASVNPDELAFQMYSRLCDDESFGPVRVYLESVRRDCTGPWIRTWQRYWPLPGKASSSDILFDSRILSLDLTRDLDRSVALQAHEVLDDGTDIKKNIVLVDVENKAKIRWFASQGEDLSCVAISGDGQRIASGSKGGCVRLWDLGGTAVENGICEHGSIVKNVLLNTNGTRILSYSDVEGSICLWDVANGREQHRFADSSLEVLCAAMNGSGTRIASGWSDGAVRFWDWTVSEAGPLVEPLGDRGGKPKCIAMSENGKYIVSGSLTALEEGAVYLWDWTATPVVGRELSRGDSSISCVAISCDGTRILAVDVWGTVKSWDGDGVRTDFSSGFTIDSQVRWAAMSSDGSGMALGTEARTLRYWSDISERTGVVVGEDGANWTCVTVNSRGTHVVSGANDGNLVLWERDSESFICTALPNHNKTVNCVMISEDASCVVSGSLSGTVRFYDGKTGKEVGELVHGHGDAVWCIAMSKDGKLVVTGSVDGTLRFWDGKNGTPLCDTILAHKGWVTCLALSANKTRVASGSLDGTLRLWDGVTWQPLVGPLEHNGRVRSVAINEDGSRVVSANHRGEVQLWDTTTTKQNLGEKLRGQAHEVWVSNGLVCGRLQAERRRVWRIGDSEGDTDGLATGDLSRNMAEYAYPASEMCWDLFCKGREVYVDHFRWSSARVVATLPAEVSRFQFCGIWHGTSPEQAQMDGNLEGSEVVGTAAAVLSNGMVCMMDLIDIQAHVGEAKECQRQLGEAKGFLRQLKGAVTIAEQIQPAVSSISIGVHSAIAQLDCMLTELSDAVREVRADVRALDTIEASAEQEIVDVVTPKFAAQEADLIPDAAAVDVFISCAGPEKQSVAYPLREMLSQIAMTAFLDEETLSSSPYTTMEQLDAAMRDCHVAIFVLSPQFVSRRWAMRELAEMFRLKEQARIAGRAGPVLIPLFYLLSVEECKSASVLPEKYRRLFEENGFFEPERQEECSTERMVELLGKLIQYAGIRNDMGETDTMFVQRVVLKLAGQFQRQKWRGRTGVPLRAPIPEISRGVFISFAGPEQHYVAFPLREILSQIGIDVFLDDGELRPSANTTWEQRYEAMRDCHVAIFVLSPQFVSRGWPMRELAEMFRLKEQARIAGRAGPVLIPLFYLLSVEECQSASVLPEKYRRLFEANGFFEPERQEECSTERMAELLGKLSESAGLRNDMGETDTEFVRRVALTLARQLGNRGMGIPSIT